MSRSPKAKACLLSRIRHPRSFPGEQSRVTNFVRRFVEAVQRTNDPPANERQSYLDIGEQPMTWERTHWIDGERLERDLDGVLEYAWVEDSPDRPRSLMSEAVIRRNASFVALVDSDRRFIGLVDRFELLAQMSMVRESAGRLDQRAS
jgi:hypothetical protein